MHRRHRALLMLAVSFSLLRSPLVMGAEATSAEPSEAWVYLEQLRHSLAKKPQSADFVQTYVPAGFSSGERETGHLALALPDCLRWDYEIPYPKSFLLCEQTVYSWNEGETSGRRLKIDADAEPGLNLLRLSVEELRQSFDAVLEAVGEQQVEVILTTRGPASEITDARFRIEPALGQLLELSYRDEGGNMTRFEISGYRPLSSSDLFTAPEGIDWIGD